MRQLIKLGFIFGVTVSSSVFSVEPVQGLYLGLLGEISHATPNPSLNFTINQVSFSGPGQISLSPIGGGGGFSIGYRMNRVRLEGEFLFNINNYGELQVGSCTLVSPNVVSPQGVCPSAISNSTGVGLGFNGNAIGLYGLFNVFYDFLSNDTNVNFYPYVGLGLGGAIIKNTANFETNNFSTTTTPVSFSASTSNNGFAAQGIIGIGYYMDDFATIGLDLRYTSTFKSNSGSSSSGTNNFGIGSINITGTFALEKTKD